MNWYVIFFDEGVIYRKAKYREGTPIETFLKALCDGEVGDDHYTFFAEDDYEDALEHYGLEEAENMEYYDLT